eukprot:jgi/Chrpa1/12536/Chrysochromulina_OHIO_Genome00013522-RA
MLAIVGTFLAIVDARPRAILTTDVEGDPFAHRDPYLNLTSDELHAHWSGNEDLYHEDDLGHALRGRAHTLAERLAMLDALHETTYVDVRLAGFAGDGEHEIHLDEDKVQRLLDATLHEEPQFVVHPPASSASHELPVRRRFLFRVTSAAPALAPSIATAIESHIASGGSPDAVPLGVVDGLVRDDYMHQRGSHVTLYLLSPRAPRREPTEFEMLQASGGASFGATPDANSSSIASKWWHKVRYAYMDALTTTPSALTIVALRISDRADAAVGSSAMARSALNEAELADDRAWEAELENLKTELRPLAAHGQTLNIETVDTSLEDCHLCAAALSTAMKAGANFVPAPLAVTGIAGAVSGQSGWGIVPTGTTWSAAHNSTVTRLLWSSAHTPHGPYSTRATLSYAQRDAAKRAPLYARITEAFAEVRQLAAHFSEFGKTVDEVLRPAEHLTFLRRLNLLAYKLQRVRSFLSLHNFRHAQYYVLSTRHDLRAMRTVLEQAGAMLKAGLVCDV